jgi:hypothetical protein
MGGNVTIRVASEWYSIRKLPSDRDTGMAEIARGIAQPHSFQEDGRIRLRVIEGRPAASGRFLDASFAGLL